MKTEAKTFNCYLKEALDGNVEAQYQLGWMFTTGEGVARNVPVGIGWYALSARSGYIHAQAVLGTLYDLGECVPKVDLKKAYKWYLLAAKQGDVQAQDALLNLIERMKLNNG